MRDRQKRVIVAMSGGVDSSVVAALLKRQGHEVIGVTLNVWPDDGQATDRPDACCALSAVEDARRVADMLGIDHYTLNFRDVFAEKVIADFTAEYLRGRTPNPCIRCNEHIKFRSLLERTSGLEADFVATGHYARIRYDGGRQRYLLLKAKDPRKDQSYVLYVLTQALLAKTLMPLGEYTKDEARSIARDLELPTANKVESQEICFVPDNDYGRFVRERAPAANKTGPILDKHGRMVGKHRGIANYTVGQRRGLGLEGGDRRYVTAIDADCNAIWVGDDEDVYHSSAVAETMNWISVPGLSASMQLSAKVRYRSPENTAMVTPLDNEEVLLRFAEPQRAITPGQAVVCYDGDVVVGGGTISKVGTAAEEMQVGSKALRADKGANEVGEWYVAIGEYSCDHEAGRGRDPCNPSR